MKILDKYIFRQFAKAFLFTSIAFVCLFILIHMVEKLDEFMDKNLGMLAIAQYYVLTIPSTLLITSPVSALLSSILVAGKLSSSSELPAIRSAGVSMRQLLTPFFTGGILILILNLLNAGWISPATFSGKNTFEQNYLTRNPSMPHENRNVHILDNENRIISIGTLAPDNAKLLKVSIEEFIGTRLISRIDADTMRYDPEKSLWMMQNASTRLFAAENEEFHFTPLKSVKLGLSPKTLAELNLQPDEMNIIRHYRYLAEKQHAGFSGLERSMVKLHNKIALPFASLIIILIGVPLSAKKKRGGLASEISITLFAGFLFLGLQKTTAIAGYQGIINPMLAAWLPNILFLGVGYAIYKTAVD
ncbi:MAG: LPS export ABC transporter permease LptG [Chlorobiaceae bacterium]|jgi:lipopolysaccharide export system permease protein|nr:LPS export ABC transporter permease LptG [Chlorobiaceae bacterium]NTV16459.1 LPS export ABC transporter permease LptG [Chlorobiaceae bacterium]